MIWHRQWGYIPLSFHQTAMNWATCDPNPPIHPSSTVIKTSCNLAKLRIRPWSYCLQKRASAKFLPSQLHPNTSEMLFVYIVLISSTNTNNLPWYLSAAFSLPFSVTTWINTGPVVFSGHQGWTSPSSSKSVDDQPTSILIDFCSQLVHRPSNLQTTTSTNVNTILLMLTLATSLSSLSGRFYCNLLKALSRIPQEQLVRKLACCH